MSVFAGLPFAPFQFHGYEGNRRVVSYGWRYDYGARRIQAAAPIPDFLEGLRAHAGRFTGHAPEAFAQMLVTEYRPGAGIGWHRDKAAFGDVVAFSFGAPATLRFRRPSAAGWERQNIVVQPRSAYLLTGPARTEWQHSIPAQAALRYSVTLRTLAQAL